MKLLIHRNKYSLSSDDCCHHIHCVDRSQCHFQHPTYHIIKYSATDVYSVARVPMCKSECRADSTTSQTQVCPLACDGNYWLHPSACVYLPASQIGHGCENRVESVMLTLLNGVSACRRTPQFDLPGISAVILIVLYANYACSVSTRPSNTDRVISDALTLSCILTPCMGHVTGFSWRFAKDTSLP